MGETIDERYTLLSELGRGGMGTVWLARDERLGREVAVKIMADAANDEARARFEREAKAVARLSSPHIVQIHDFGFTPQPYMVMERLVGEDLHRRLEKQGRLSPEATLELIRQCARGLTTAHEAGIIHRDLKPANIFITQSRGPERVLLVDFGLAKALGAKATLASITQTGVSPGTPKFMSPNHLGAAEDARDDVWSLAVVAYQCLTGVSPFEAGSLIGIVERILACDATPVREVAPKLPRGLDQVFRWAFHHDRTQRFQSPDDLVLALEQGLAADASPSIGAHTIEGAPVPNPDGSLNRTVHMPAPPAPPPRRRKVRPRAAPILWGAGALGLLLTGGLLAAVVLPAASDVETPKPTSPPQPTPAEPKGPPLSPLLDEKEHEAYRTVTKEEVEQLVDACWRQGVTDNASHAPDLEVRLEGHRAGERAVSSVRMNASQPDRYDRFVACTRQAFAQRMKSSVDGERVELVVLLPPGRTPPRETTPVIPAKPVPVPVTRPPGDDLFGF